MSTRDEIWFWRGVTVASSFAAIAISLVAIALSLGVLGR